jgi:hypothetical protein
MAGYVRYCTKGTADLYFPCDTAVLATVTLFMVASHDPQHNHLLAALPPAERERIFPHL